IGMQHLIDAAHRNFDMTVFVHNNMLYGMTGGQPSEFTPPGFKTPTNPEGSTKPHYNICELMVEAGASFVSRINGIGDFSEHMAAAISKKGFSMVEIMELCPSYGMKANPGMKLSKIVEQAELDIKVFTDVQKKIFELKRSSEKDSLLKENEKVKISFQHSLSKPLSIMIYGSAGGGVQSAAELLVAAGVKSGLQVSKKGSYPVTVGIGFSAAEVILSPGEIHYTGSPNPDHAIVLTEDGYIYAKALISKLQSGKVWVDSGVSIEKTGAEIEKFNFIERLGQRNAAIFSVFYLLSKTQIFPIEALIEAFNDNKISQKFDVNKLLQFD
ncbi:MAG TPA: thiamine pyrophosphate-dependent enzyme, partial [Bacteroidales bacterium]